MIRQRRGIHDNAGIRADKDRYVIARIDRSGRKIKSIHSDDRITCCGNTGDGCDRRDDRDRSETACPSIPRVTWGTIRARKTTEKIQASRERITGTCQSTLIDICCTRSASEARAGAIACKIAKRRTGVSASTSVGACRDRLTVIHIYTHTDSTLDLIIREIRWRLECSRALDFDRPDQETRC